MLQPIQNKLLVKLNARKQSTESGIIIPEAAQDAENWGEVVAIGNKVTDFVVGDSVFIRDTQGTHYIKDGVDFILIEDFRIVAKKSNSKEA